MERYCVTRSGARLDQVKAERAIEETVVVTTKPLSGADRDFLRIVLPECGCVGSKFWFASLPLHPLDQLVHARPDLPPALVLGGGEASASTGSRSVATARGGVSRATRRQPTPGRLGRGPLANPRATPRATRPRRATRVGCLRTRQRRRGETSPRKLLPRNCEATARTGGATAAGPNRARVPSSG